MTTPSEEWTEHTKAAWPEVNIILNHIWQPLNFPLKEDSIGIQFELDLNHIHIQKCYNIHMGFRFVTLIIRFMLRIRLLPIRLFRTT